jgi:cytochrome c oxidase cbb3-type subunit 3
MKNPDFNISYALQFSRARERNFRDDGKFHGWNYEDRRGADASAGPAAVHRASRLPTRGARDERSAAALPPGRPRHHHHRHGRGTRPAKADPRIVHYERNAWHVSEGQRLYEEFNCVECHAHGGGGIGPALIDDEWTYGSASPQIVATLIQGRPNGMPSFRNILTEEQMWQLAAYVRAMGGQLPKDVPPSRGDNLAGPAADHAGEEARAERQQRGGRRAVNGIQSAADPAGAHAAITYDLFGLFLGVTGLFFLLVLVFLGWAIWRKDRGTARDRRLRVTVAGWAGCDHARPVRPDHRQLFRRSRPRLRRGRQATHPHPGDRAAMVVAGRVS